MEDDGVIRSLKRSGTPVTRENYIRRNWVPVPQPWTPEHEAELPPELQNWAVFGEPA